MKKLESKSRALLLLQPETGLNIDPAPLDPETIAVSREAGKQAHSLAEGLNIWRELDVSAPPTL